MLNQVVLVGRLVRDPELKELENEKSVANITLAVPRSYKNENGEYDTDFIDCTLWNGVGSSAAEYCKKGDLLGVKGRAASKPDEETKRNNLLIVAEKVTYLSRKSQEKEQEETER